MDPRISRSSSSSDLPVRSATPPITVSPASHVTRAMKSNSTTNLPTLTTTSGNSSQPHDRSRSDNLDFNTISRTPTPLSNGSRTPPSASHHHPDLSNEVATLSTKLINAINHQTNLDDSLQSTRGDLESANVEIERLRKEVESEKQQRINAERTKRKLESEVEALTSQLFEEANSMVADARRQHEDAEQRNEHLKSQLSNAEILLTSHQDQLRDLKEVLSQIQAEEPNEQTHVQTSAPSTPIASVAAKRSSMFNQDNVSTGGIGTQQVQPDHPLSFSHVLSPVLRSDLQAFDDFVAMLKVGVTAAPPVPRTTSGNFSGLNVMGISSLSNFNQSSVTKSPQLTTTTSNSSLATSSPQSQNTPGAFPQTTSTDFAASPTIASSLKDQKFYKRALAEDIDPTLRLDAAPGLSWLSRRNMVSSMVSGNLIVEPFGPSHRYWSPSYSCALCGESREAELYVRRHRFYKGDTDDAQRYMVCDYCLGRLRATGDFINFLRMVRSGYWKGESLEDSKIAWEQCTKLRERMFWARLGGGVIPTFAPVTDDMQSPKSSRNVSAEEPPSEAVPTKEISAPVPGTTVSELTVTGTRSMDSKSGSPERRVTSPERRPMSSDSTNTTRFLAARSRFESSASSDSESRPTTPATESGVSERKQSGTSSRPVSPAKSPRKKSVMPGSLP